MRLIDTGALIDVLNSQDLADWLSEQEEYTPASIVEHALETLPTVDAEPVRHGRWKKAEPHGVWVYSNAYRQCSECDTVIYRALKMNYCPNCGARMVGGEW